MAIKYTATQIDENPVGPDGIGKSGSPFKAYVALLEQTDTANPVATVLNGNDDNFLGNIVWTRDSEGAYIGTLQGAFPLDKTSIQTTSTNQNCDLTVGNWNQPDQIAVYTNIMTTNTAADGRLTGTPIEIKVYQN